MVGQSVHSTTTHTSLLKTHVIFNNKTFKTIKQYMYNIILPLNFPHIYLHGLYLIKPHQTPHKPTRPVLHCHCSLIPCLILHVEPSDLFIRLVLLTNAGKPSKATVRPWHHVNSGFQSNYLENSSFLDSSDVIPTDQWCLTFHELCMFFPALILRANRCWKNQKSSHKAHVMKNQIVYCNCI